MPIIIKNNCTGCGACVATCPAGALYLESETADGRGKKLAVVNQVQCQQCGTCLPSCRRQSLALGADEE